MLVPLVLSVVTFLSYTSRPMACFICCYQSFTSQTEGERGYQTKHSVVTVPVFINASSLVPTLAAWGSLDASSSTLVIAEYLFSKLVPFTGAGPLYPEENDRGNPIRL